MKVKVIQKKQLVSTVAMASVLVCGVMMGQNAMAAGITEALTGGKPMVDFRLRAETVDQDGAKEDATALTARTRIGYMSGAYSGLKGFFEFENTTALIDDYNIPKGLKGEYPVVADPEGSEVNQAFLSYGGVKNLLVKMGRQRVILDNARFVGNVGWRQNEQTYDALLLNTTAVKDLSASYAFVDQVNTIVGGEIETDAHLLNVSYKGVKDTKITGYAYMIDTEADAPKDSQTIGASIDGKVAIGEGTKMMYGLEYAQMSEYADNESSDSPAYYKVELGAKVKKITVKLGHEVLGNDGGSSFQTPLATKHKFNGWADKFLTTPTDGLVDTYLTAVGKVKGVKLLATYHMFSSDKGGDDYGSELDLLAVKKFGKNYSAGLKYATYMEGDLAAKTDTSKLWLWGGIKF